MELVPRPMSVGGLFFSHILILSELEHRWRVIFVEFTKLKLLLLLGKTTLTALVEHPVLEPRTTDGPC